MAPDYEGLKASDLPETFGRSVYEPKDGPERLALWQQIVASSEPARVDGVLVEPRWGRMLLDLYADLDPARQQTRRNAHGRRGGSRQGVERVSDRKIPLRRTRPGDADSRTTASVTGASGVLK